MVGAVLRLLIGVVLGPFGVRQVGCLHRPVRIKAAAPQHEAGRCRLGTGLLIARARHLCPVRRDRGRVGHTSPRRPCASSEILCRASSALPSSSASHGGAISAANSGASGRPPTKASRSASASERDGSHGTTALPMSVRKDMFLLPSFRMASKARKFSPHQELRAWFSPKVLRSCQAD